MIRTHIDGDTLHVSLASPEKKNALNPEVVWAIREALGRRAWEAIVLRSDVAGWFSVGWEFTALTAATEVPSEVLEEGVRGYVDLLRQLAESPCPVIAEVDGIAIGGGVDLIGSCDLVIASDRAAFSIAQVRNGVFPLTTSGVLIPQIGAKAFLYWALSGQYYDARKAHRLGLVSTVVASASLSSRVDQLLEQLRAYDPAVLELGLRAVHHQTSAERTQHLDYLGDRLVENATHLRESHGLQHR